MGQQDIVGDSVRGVAQNFRDSFQRKRKDTSDYSWHAGKVAEANESFARKGVGAKTSVAKSKAARGKRKAMKKMGK